MTRRSTVAPATRSAGRLEVVSAYDRVVGLVLSLLMLLGVSVGVLLFVWLGSKFVSPIRTVPVTLQPETSGGDPTGTSGDGVTLDAPSEQEIRRDTNVPLPEFRQTLAAVEDLVNKQAADLDSTLQRPEPESQGGGRSQGTGAAPAFGSGEGAGGLARGLRWEIGYASGGTLDAYAKELDFFGIELAAIGRDGGVEYVRDLARSPPTVERDRLGPERRLYMQWREGSVRGEADRKLLARAQIETAGKRLVQFIPLDVEERLARLEYEFAKRDARDIRKTRFGVRPTRTGFEFFVEEQIPR